MECLQKHLPRPSAVRFLLTDFQTIAEHEFDILNVPILDRRGNFHSLLEERLNW